MLDNVTHSHGKDNERAGTHSKGRGLLDNGTHTVMTKIMRDVALTIRLVEC